MDTGKSPLAIFAVSLGLFLSLGSYLHWSLRPELRRQRAALGDVADRLTRIEQSIALLHFSKDPHGQPVQAILDHLRYWSDREDRFGSSLAERPILDENLRLAMDALRRLGSDAYAAVERAFFAAARDPAQRQFRKRLLRVLKELDPTRAKSLADRILSTPGRDPQLRTVAGEILVDLDPQLAGQRLRHVILNETARGVRHVMPNPTAKNLPPGLKFGSYAGFFNLVNLYLRTRDAQKVDVLLLLLRTEGHDIATLQAAIAGLEDKRAAVAVGPMKQMFEQPRTQEQRNVYVRRRLAWAIAKIDGVRACRWLTERLAKEEDSTVRRTISQLLKANCGGPVKAK